MRTEPCAVSAARGCLPGDRLGRGFYSVGHAGRCLGGCRRRAGGGMTDDRELAGLDPFALLDTEAGRLDAFLSGLGESGWKRASRCAGWTVRDVLGHLAAGEDYHRACLDGTVAAFLAGFAGAVPESARPVRLLARCRIGPPARPALRSAARARLGTPVSWRSRREPPGGTATRLLPAHHRELEGIPASAARTFAPGPPGATGAR